MMTSALRVSTTKVSMNTPIMATHALLVGILHVGLSVGMGGGAHTGLVGEQAALGALRDGSFDGVAESRRR